MWQEILKFLKKQNRITKVITITSVIILIILYYLLAIIYKNYSINSQINNLKEQISQLKQNTIDQSNKILYYKTDAYAEKVLREKLGYQKEGEKVFALPRKDPEREKLIKEQQRYQENQDNRPNIVKWWSFFFEKEEMEEEV